MKSILFGILLVLTLLVTSQAHATVSLLPGASWCPNGTSLLTPAANQVIIFSTLNYVHDVTGQCQILTIGTHNYSVGDLGPYGLNGPDYIKSLEQGTNVQGEYYSGANFTGTHVAHDYGWMTNDTSSWLGLGVGVYPVSMGFHKRSGT